MLLKQTMELFGQYGSPILSAFPGAYRDHPGTEVHILYSKRDALIDPQPGPVHQLGHETRRSLHKTKNPFDLFCGQDDRNAMTCLNPFQSTHVPQWPLNDRLVEKDEGVQGLGLSRSSHFASDGQMIEKSLHLGCA